MCREWRDGMAEEEDLSLNGIWRPNFLEEWGGRLGSATPHWPLALIPRWGVPATGQEGQDRQGARHSTGGGFWHLGPSRVQLKAKIACSGRGV